MRRILEVSQQVSAMHIACAISTVEMMDCGSFGLIDHGSNYVKPDTFMLSKGHAAIGQYIVPEHQGVLNKWGLDLYCKPSGRLGGYLTLVCPGVMPTLGRLPSGWAWLWTEFIAIETAALGKVSC